MQPYISFLILKPQIQWFPSQAPCSTLSLSEPLKEAGFGLTMKRSRASSSSSSISDLLPSTKEQFLQLLGVAAIAVSVAMSCNYFLNYSSLTITLPFCDNGADSSDFCEPCPSNGLCSEGKLSCIDGYRKHGRLCIEDGELNETAKRLSKMVELQACGSYAHFLCHGTGAIWFQEEEILRSVWESNLKVNYGIDSHILEHTIQKVREIVESSFDIKTSPDGMRELKCPDWLAEQYKPLPCILRIWFLNHIHYILPISLLLVAFVRLLWRVHMHSKLSTRAEQIYEQVCEALEENAVMVKNSRGDCGAWVVASRLRDHLLLPNERKNASLWKKVGELVQEDSRIDRYPLLIKGETKIVWEWQVEGSLHSRMRTTQRVSKMRHFENETAVSKQESCSRAVPGLAYS
ncbi:hypothetical protein AMTRI_Chr10g229050 [Amborella trichopoda]